MNPLQHFPEGAEQHILHPSHAKPGIHPLPRKLYVVTMMSNAPRWRARYRNYEKFARHIACAGAILYTCEIAFGEREFEITEANNPCHLQLRTTHELWHKENALNLLIQRLPADAEYIAWIDADITFARSDWAQETLHLLQHYDFIQMFSTGQDLTTDGELLDKWPGFLYNYQTKRPDPHKPEFVEYEHPYEYNGYIGHPGYAWAARRSSLSKVGMLIDWAPLGSADWHMAWAMIGKMQKSLGGISNENYRKWCYEWEARCEQHIRRNVGYMPGTAFHLYHGAKSKRQYAERWKFLEACGFDPVRDLIRDHQGLWQLSDKNILFRDGYRDYAWERDEDEVS